MMIRRLIMMLATAAAIGAAAQVPATDEAMVEATDSLALESEDTYNAYTGSPAMDAFINAPVEVFPSIDPMTRMDMADYFNSGSPKPSKNVFKGDCRIVSASPAQVTVATTEASQAEISILPAKGDSIIMVITTLDTPVPDSSVSFYTYPEWKPIEKELFAMPGLDEWTVGGNATPRADIENAVPFILARITYDPASDALTLENKLGEFLPAESRDIVKGALTDTLVYQWDGRRMVPRK